LIKITPGLKSEKTRDKKDLIEKNLEIGADHLVLKWKSLSQNIVISELSG